MLSRFRLRRVLALPLLMAALWQVGQGGYIHAKALLAQELIARSWDARVTSGAVSPPWPWADTVPVALLEVPRLGVRSWILADASGRSLAFGPGMVGSEQAGAALIAGHRDTHFRFVQALEKGDRLRLQSINGQWREYMISETAIIDTDGGEALRAVAGELYLLTCYPFEAITPGGGQRYVVRAEPVISAYGV